MKFQLTPQRADATLAISVSGETVIINGIEYDLSPLAEGQSISFGAGSAKRDNGITVSLPLPYPQNPSIDPMQVYEVEAVDGSVAVPGHDAEQPANIVAGIIDWPAPEKILSVTMAQARQVLIDNNLYTAVEQMLQQMPGKEGKKARAKWEYAQTVQRDDPLFIALATGLDLSEQDLDNLFLAASQY